MTEPGTRVVSAIGPLCLQPAPARYKSLLPFARGPPLNLSHADLTRLPLFFPHYLGPMGDPRAESRAWAYCGITNENKRTGKASPAVFTVNQKLKKRISRKKCPLLGL